MLIVNSKEVLIHPLIFPLFIYSVANKTMLSVSCGRIESKISLEKFPKLSVPTIKGKWCYLWEGSSMAIQISKLFFLEQNYFLPLVKSFASKPNK